VSVNLADPADPVVKAALTRRCDMCRADPGVACRNTIRDEPLPGKRLCHYIRVEQWDVTA